MSAFSLLFFFLAVVSVNPAIGSPRLNIPARPSNAPTGTEFLRATRKLDENAREKAIEREIKRGNVPSFLRILKPVKLAQNTIFWVTPDYLAIGSDRDFVRVPMTPITAQKIADQFGAILPTPKIVDRIYQQSEIKYRPAPMQVRGFAMTTNDAYLRHHHLIELQRGRKRNGSLMSGHKKDVVLSNLLLNRPYRVAIYGWHRPNGRAIQPLSLVHHNQYADYSHGVRLVANTVTVNGRPSTAKKILTERRSADIASYEGPLRLLRVKTMPQASGTSRRWASPRPYARRHQKWR